MVTKKRKGSKIHAAVDTLGHLLAVTVTPANEQERHQVAELAVAIQEATNENVTLAYVDQDAAAEGICLEVVKHQRQKRLCVITSEMGCGKDICLAGSFPKAGPGL